MLYSKSMTRTQKLALIISILASFVAFLDGSVINVALPAITKELGGGLAVQQWVVDAYLITLGALMLLAGSLSDIFGRTKIMRYGLIGFGAASLLCAIAPTAEFLIGARALQGVAGALLVPSSLALIIATFKDKAGKAIGTWTAWTGIAFIVGPVLGGFLVDAASWRWVFAINFIPVIICIGLLKKLALSEKKQTVRLDLLGAFLCTVGLGGTVFALIEQPHFGWQSPLIFIPFAIGLSMLAGFILYEKRATEPMLPLSLFAIGNFRIGNIATFAIYGGLAIATFVLTIYLQQVIGYSAVAAGMALLPVTIIMFFLSPKFGTLAGQFGPRLFMTIGPMVAALGFLLFAELPEAPNYWANILPAVTIFGLGLSATVAPLTAAILEPIPQEKAGIASAINNAISRVAGLITIALAGIAIGTQLTQQGFQRVMIATAVIVAAGGIVSWLGIRNKTPISQPRTRINY